MNKIFKRVLIIIVSVFVFVTAILALKIAVIDYTAGKSSQVDISESVSGNGTSVIDDVTNGFKREHVMVDWKSLNQSYIPNYLSGFAVPMDGTNGNPNYLVPGQTEDMIPQGLTYFH